MKKLYDKFDFEIFDASNESRANRVCTIMQPFKDIQDKTIDNLIPLISDFTRKQNREVQFYYNVKTRKPISPIMVGQERNTCIPTELVSNISKSKLGLIHTHPVLDHDTESECIYSDTDLKFFLKEDEGGIEQTLVCPLTTHETAINIIHKPLTSNKKIHDFISYYRTMYDNVDALADKADDCREHKPTNKIQEKECAKILKQYKRNWSSFYENVVPILHKTFFGMTKKTI